MKYSLLALCLLTLIPGHLMSQNLNLDKHSVRVARTALPQEPLTGQNAVDSLAPRTYQIALDWGYDFTSTVYYQQPSRESSLLSQVRLEGWREFKDYPAHLNITVRFTDFQIISNQIQTRQQVVKNKDGSSKTYNYYWIEYRYRFESQYSAQNQAGDIVSSNRNLVSERMGKYNSQEFNTQTEAYRWQRMNDENVRERLLRENVDNSILQLNSEINRRWGYLRTRDELTLMGSDSKKWEGQAEFDGHVRAIVSFMESWPYTEINPNQLNETQKHILYFDSLIQANDGDDKFSRKLRYACLWNNATICLAAERWSECETYASAMGETGFDMREGVYFTKRIADRKEDLQKNPPYESFHFSIDPRAIRPPSDPRQ